MQKNIRNIILILFTHNYIIKVLIFVYINILIEKSFSLYLYYHVEQIITSSNAKQSKIIFQKCLLFIYKKKKINK